MGSTPDQAPRPPGSPVPTALCESLRRMGLLAEGDYASGEPLRGGVSSDIWRIDLPAGPVCIKRALPKLKVAAEWYAPVERNSFEVAWIRCAGDIWPNAVPEVVGEDRDGRAFAMTYLEPSRYPVWKERLRDGVVSRGFAAQVGAILGRIHAATADRADVAAQFPTDAGFYDIRLEPYLVEAARKHPDRAAELESLVETTAHERHVLVHGDVSPKNILAGPEGPVFLDAECAWFGDPAFDLAFCLNHLLLKALWVPPAQSALFNAFDALRDAYFRCAAWEPVEVLEARTARLLPGLMLARVDGKSPVEYLTAETQRDRVRTVTRRLLDRPVERLAGVRDAWAEALARISHQDTGNGI
jgi:aminoglycoside phosphotransferase (APT) family kinase protein